MRSLRTLLLLGILSTFFYTALPASAQRPSPRDTDDKLRERIREVDRERREDALRWARERSVPVRLRQADGRTVQLVDVAGERPVYLTSLNQRAAYLTHTDALYPGGALGLSLTGLGQTVGIWDAGHVLQGHQEIAGRVDFGDEADADNHATHVGGTLIGGGVQPTARGMAYEARLHSYDWTNDATEMTNEAEDGLLLSNHSYGMIAGWYYGDFEDTGAQWYWFGDPRISEAEDYTFGWYTSEAAQFDRVVYLNPYYLPVLAAGNDRGEGPPGGGSYRGLDEFGEWTTYNMSSRPIAADGGADGFDSISGAAVAKNVLTVGSVGYSGVNRASARVSAFSSFGPTDDGRVKPDVVGSGERVYSSTSGSPMQYGYSSGTSMATPNVTGSLVLLQQYHQQLRGTPMRAATLKGLAIHTAADLGLPGPDYRYGWGLLDVEAAAEHIREGLANALAVAEEELGNAATYTETVRVEEAGPLRVTLSWTDPASARLPLRGPSSLDDPSAHLRNDLDLRLIDDASGTVYEPFRLSASRPADPATTGDNTVDPVEQVFVLDAEPGSYTLVVSHKGSLLNGNPQAFSLLVSGAAVEAPAVTMGPLASEANLDAVVLRWQTFSERNQGTFAVERAPVTFIAGNNRQVGLFEPVGTVDTHGAEGQTTEYEFTDRGVLSGHYLYRVLYEDAQTTFVAAELEVTVPVPDDYAVVSNYPNPFVDQTEVVLDLPRAQQVRLEIFDTLGRRVKHLADREMPAGRHLLQVDASSWASGVYFLQVETPNGVRTHRMVVVR